MKRLRLIALGCMAASIALAGCLPPPPPEPVRHSATFRCLGVPQTWVVPDDVQTLNFQVAGGMGGGSFPGPVVVKNTSQGAFPVTPGETLQIDVGCNGGDPVGGTGGVGGWNGGGAGGNAPGGIGGGGGGGASDIRQGGTGLENRVVVASGIPGAGGGATDLINAGTLNGFCSGGGTRAGLEYDTTYPTAQCANPGFFPSGFFPNPDPTPGAGGAPNGNAGVVGGYGGVGGVGFGTAARGGGGAAGAYIAGGGGGGADFAASGKIGGPGAFGMGQAAPGVGPSPLGYLGSLTITDGGLVVLTWIA